MPAPQETDVAKIQKCCQAQVPATCETRSGSKPPSAAARSLSSSAVPCGALTRRMVQGALRPQHQCPRLEPVLGRPQRPLAPLRRSPARPHRPDAPGDRIRPHRYLLGLATGSHRRRAGTRKQVLSQITMAVLPAWIIPGVDYLGGRPDGGRMGAIAATRCLRGPDHIAGTASTAAATA